MNDQTHEQRLKSIEAECSELRRQILKLEFQHKKDVLHSKRESDASWRRFEAIREQTQKHLNHLSQLTGMSFETLYDIDDRLAEAAKPLSKKSQISD